MSLKSLVDASKDGIRTPGPSIHTTAGSSSSSDTWDGAGDKADSTGSHLELRTRNRRVGYLKLGTVSAMRLRILSVLKELFEEKEEVLRRLDEWSDSLYYDFFLYSEALSCTEDPEARSEGDESAASI
ncbi:hypothetical protein Pcinc_003395 [Petrolisthes cinctipes]|uniref:Uncharacterized protein n=1 Tax=Petrolisthes cinctipes TaxID=88211 RepID=A0AAE1L2K3_PETCI|nr:hypothetical protein Pcinc_003395 [Petrolisthes cinctipes]